MNNDNNLLLMSDELKDQVPELQPVIDEYSNFVFVAIELSVNDAVDAIVGSVIGIEPGAKEPKLEFRAQIDIVYKLVQVYIKTPDVITISKITLEHNGCYIVQDGPWKINTLKFHTIDAKLGMCTLDIDLKAIC